MTEAERQRLREAAAKPMTVFEAWKLYERELLPPDAGAIQREETRRAFYAGAAFMLRIVIDVAEASTEEEGVGKMEAIAGELEASVFDLRGVDDGEGN